MKKRIWALALAAMMLLALLAACGGGDVNSDDNPGSDTEGEATEAPRTPAPLELQGETQLGGVTTTDPPDDFVDEISPKYGGVFNDDGTFTPVELTNKKISWYAHYKFTNDTSDPEFVLQNNTLKLYTDMYGGEMTWVQTEWGDRYAKLATLINANESPDLSVWEKEVFPYFILKNMYTPIDEYINFNSKLWKGTRELSDMFAVNGKHFMAAVSPGENNSGVVYIYRQSVVDAAGLDDPYELYLNDNWTWDTFYDLCNKFTDPEKQTFGVTGYWPVSGIVYSTGGRFFYMDESGKVINNMNDPAIERAENFLFEFGKNGLVEEPQVSGTFQKGKALFFGDGYYKFGEMQNNSIGKNLIGDLKMVPPPRDPQADAYYINCIPNSFMIPNGAKNIDGAIAYLTCARLAYLAYYSTGDDEFVERDKYGLIDERKARTDQFYTEQYYAVLDDMFRSDKFTYIADLYFGLGVDDSAKTWNFWNDTFRYQIPWSTSRDTYYGEYDSYVRNINGG